MSINSMRCLLFLIFLTSQSSLADNLCPPVESKGEGHWPLSEASFSKDAAVKQLKILNDYFEGKVEVAEEFIYQSNIIIEGSFLRAEVDKWRHEPKNYKYAKEQFCRFMLQRAHIVH